MVKCHGFFWISNGKRIRNLPASGQVTTVPNVPPNKAEMNLPRSDGGDHFEMRLCSAGYKTP